MIRDEYKKEQQQSGLTTKELKDIKNLGERAYYTTSITKMTATIKSLDFSCSFSLVLSSIILVLIIIGAIINPKTLLTVIGILGTIFTVLMFSWCIVWYTVLKKHYTKKIEDYKLRIKELSEKDLRKKMSLYEKSQKE